MLINRVPEEESGRAGDVELQNLEDTSTVLQTAEEIYQIMAKSSNFEGDGDKALSTRDLVILYKNIDIDTKLVSTAKQQISKSSNQYVENVIHKDDRGSEGSDVSEDISNEDFNHVFAINDERIDLLHNFGDTLCHKFGDMQMRTSNLATEYDRHFLFNDPFIKEQLKSFHKISKPKQSDSTVLPASLLDYICCKRIEDNYNFYMDNIIKYVQNTIEQLKRISNGDYLTEKAKEKWREVYDGDIQTSKEPSQPYKKTVLASSVSILLRVKDKRTDKRITWDDIVHSEMDIRSLSKILEKKVIVEVPKMICGTYRLFSKRCKDNLIITCKKDEQEQESRVDVVLKLQRSKSGQVISNIDSIMILKSLPTIATEAETRSNDLLAVEFENAIDVKDEKSVIKLDATQIDDRIGKEFSPNDTTDCSLAADRETNVEQFSEDDYDFLPPSDSPEDDEYHSSRVEADLNTIVTDDLHSIIHQLSKQTPFIEESEDSMKNKKSPMRVRMKSPYENKSYVIEEKKRKKLLEIREKREHKKNVISENRRISKHRYGRGATVVQASNSVTKLSITNKHFYNSIYGHSMNINTKKSQKYYKKQTKDCIPEIELGNDEETHYNDAHSPPSVVSPEKNSQKYINRSYYLDEAETEVMYLQRKENHDLTKEASSASPTANDIGVSLNLLEQLIAPSTTEFSLTDTLSSLQQNILCDDSFVNTKKEMTQKNVVMSTRSAQVSVPKNSLKIEASTQEENGKTSTSVECRRSIDKIYDLIKQIGKTDSLEVITSQSKTTNNNDKIQMTNECRGSSSAQANDSGTSIKHQLTSANPGFYSFEKANTVLKTSKDSKKKYNNPMSVIPKVKISPKLPPNNKFSNKTNNKELQKLSGSKIQENPLKAISQLIHEFDNVQKMIGKSEKESKNNKTSDRLATQDKSSFRQNFQRIPKQDQSLRDSEATFTKNSVLKERKRQSTRYGSFKITQQHVQPEETLLDTTSRKKITDIIDEVKELRGEAVRGPAAKKLSRFNSLAQPKKTCLQSQQEEPQNRFRKPIMDKLSKPTPPITNIEKSIAYTRTKQRKISDGLPASTKQPLTPGSPSERFFRAKPSLHNNPNHEGYGKRVLGPVAKPPCNHGNVNKSPEQLKGKMVAVETYVKSHYEREMHALEIGDSTNAHKSRAPLIPNDLDVVSSESTPSIKEESSTLGIKLHHMIDSMISSTIPVLGAVAECNESVPKEGDAFDDISIEGRTKSDEIILSGSDYLVDIFEDKNIVTAVSIISQDHKDVEVANDSNSNTNICETNPLCLPNNLPNPEDAICRQISSGSFQKSIRIKQLTTPKLSMENLFISQSRESNSLVVMSKLSQHRDFQSETITELKILPALSNTRFTDFGFTTFPMQIATVGYALPHVVKLHSNTKINIIENEVYNSKVIKTVISSENMSNTGCISNSNHCFKSTVKKTFQKPIQSESVISILTNKNMNEVILGNCGECAIRVENNERKAQDNTVKTKTTEEDIIAVDIKKSNISNSTSLDILVGLLNEIKKITSYQAHIPKQEEENTHTEFENKELEIILNNVSVKESSVDHSVKNAMSLHSLDNLQILEARASNFFYLSSNIEEYNNDKKMADKNIRTNTKVLYEPLRVDEEVNAKTWQTECRHRFTEAPSQLLPVSVSTNVTDSLIKLINNSSSHSVYSVTDCESFTSLVNEIKEKPTNAMEKFNATPPAILKIQYINDKEKHADINKGQNSQTLVEFDSLMKMKRDILVTVYSILVLTVFAALSFPELMYRL